MIQAAIIGDAARVAEFRRLVAEKPIQLIESQAEALPDGLRLCIDLNLDQHPERLQHYARHKGLTVMGCAVLRSLAEMAQGIEDMQCRLFGMNALPTFIHRELIEISLFRPADREAADLLLQELNLQTVWVEDQVGMVTPRIMAMIINESFFTQQEGTASGDDIDTAMKLGLNYPGGPMEWLARIGPALMLQLLEALQRNTGDPRYIVARKFRQYVQQQAG